MCAVIGCLESVVADRSGMHALLPCASIHAGLPHHAVKRIVMAA